MATYSLTLEGLTCNGCVNAVKTALNSLDGIESMEVTQQEAKISGDVEINNIIEAVENAGFEAIPK